MDRYQNIVEVWVAGKVAGSFTLPRVPLGEVVNFDDVLHRVHPHSSLPVYVTPSGEVTPVELHPMPPEPARLSLRTKPPQTAPK